MWRVHFQQFREHPTFGSWYQRVESRPGWVTRIALIAAVLVVVIPIVLITLTALIVGLAVFMVLGVIAWVIATVRGFFQALFGGGQSSGRRNVRVIVRD